MRLWRRQRSELDERDEALAHIRIEADRLEHEEGLTPTDAMAEARARFGYSEHLDPVRSSSGAAVADVLARDVRLAVRRLKSNPISTATILVSLVIGIGVNTAIFSLADQALVRALPVEDPHELVQLAWDGSFVGGGRGGGHLMPHPLYVDLRGNQSVFEDLVARSPGDVTLLIGERSERAQVELVTGGYFSTLGVRPALGRVLGPEDDLILGGHPVVVLSHAYWQSRFGGDRGVIGSQIRMNAEPVTIVGVAEPGFHGTDWSAAPALFVPMMMNDLAHSWGGLDERRTRFQHIYARLRPEVSATQAEASLEGWFEAYKLADMEREGWPGRVEPADLQSYLNARLLVLPGAQGQAPDGADLREPMLILATATLLLLLLACLNVANLSLARAAARRRDAAVRTALGASRGQIVRERLVEAGLVAGVGGFLGVVLAPAVSEWVLSYMSVNRPEMALSAALDLRALIGALVFSTVATILSGVGPAWFVASARPMGALRVRDDTGSGGLPLRRALVVGQVSLALVFLVGASLFGRTLSTLRDAGPGFETAQLVSFRLTPTNDGYDFTESKLVIEEVLRSVTAIPEVSSVSIGMWPVLNGGGWNNSMLVEGPERLVTDEYLPMNAVTPGFFETLGVPIILGRDFDSRDRWEGDGWNLRSAVVSESFVEEFLGGQYPIGTRIDFGADPSRAARMEIVGVIRGYHEYGLRDAPPQVFFSAWERTVGTSTFYFRTRADTEGVAARVRATVGEIDPGLTITDYRTLDEQIDRALVFERLLASLGRAFGAFATLLAMIGLYAVLSFAAQSRTKEMGIRVALGAPSHSAGGLILGEAMRLAGIGVLVALPIVWGLGGFVEAQLFGVDPLDPGSMALASLLLLVACFLASAGPAWRASTVSPVEAFRVE